MEYNIFAVDGLLFYLLFFIQRRPKMKKRAEPGYT